MSPSFISPRFLSLLLLLLSPFQTHSTMSSTSLILAPNNIRQPLEITLTFTTDSTIGDTNQILLSMPGYTRGSCMNLDDGANELDQTIIRRSPSAKWNAYWYEGTVANSYSDSYLKFMPATGVTIGTGTHVITVDKTIKVKRNCGTKSTEVHTLTDETLGTSTVTATNFVGGCYFTSTRVDVVQPLDRQWMEVSVAFKPAMNVLAGESVNFNMAGFTNGNFTGLTHKVWSVVRTVCVGKGGCNDDTLTIVEAASEVLFKALWLEGSPLATDTHRAGYVNSTLILKVAAGQSLIAGTTYTATLDKITTQLGVICSIPEDYDKITISTNATLGVVSKVVVEHTGAVGNGCKHLGYCSGHGTCDYCTEMCTCEKEYGGAGAIVDLDISPMCDQRVCPANYAWGSMPTSTSMGHEMMECSGAGHCDRSKGTCLCFEGFAGLTCERRTCPILESQICAGHGTCLSMKQLSMKPDALPLSDPTNFTLLSGRTYPIYGGGREGAITQGNVTWDERTSYRCHCDSSWPVGLGSGERQMAEYFGAACQFKRCPSGDDPMTHNTPSAATPAFTETNCEGVLAEGGKGAGKAGNLCHIDCSNRGLCDHDTGTCECFQGFWGSACEILKDLNVAEGE